MGYILERHILENGQETYQLDAQAQREFQFEESCFLGDKLVQQEMCEANTYLVDGIEVICAYPNGDNHYFLEIFQKTSGAI